MEDMPINNVHVDIQLAPRALWPMLAVNEQVIVEINHLVKGPLFSV